MAKKMPLKKKGLPLFSFPPKKNLNPNIPKGLAPSFKIMKEGLRTKTVK